MKKYLFLLISICVLAACSKGIDYSSPKFPGFTAGSTEAIWVVYRHNITDLPYVTSVLPLQTPPTTYIKFDSTLVASRQKEVSPFSLKLYAGGEVANISKNASNENVWVKVPTLKWEPVGDNINILKNVAGKWQSVIIGFKDEDKLILKYKKSYFGDATTDQESVVTEIYFSLFKI